MNAIKNDTILLTVWMNVIILYWLKMDVSRTVLQSSYLRGIWTNILVWLRYSKTLLYRFACSFFYKMIRVKIFPKKFITFKSVIWINPDPKVSYFRLNVSAFVYICVCLNFRLAIKVEPYIMWICLQLMIKNVLNYI